MIAHGFFAVTSGIGALKDSADVHWRTRVIAGFFAIRKTDAQIHLGSYRVLIAQHVSGAGGVFTLRGLLSIKIRAAGAKAPAIVAAAHAVIITEA